MSEEKNSSDVEAYDEEKIEGTTRQLQRTTLDTSQRSKPVAHVKPMIADASQRLIPVSPIPSASQQSPNVLHKTTGENVKTPTLSNRLVLTATKAKKCRFYRNGDRFFKGVYVAISSERYRTLDSIAEEVTRALLGTGCVLLPSGVRILYALADGRKVLSPDELKDGEDYVCAGPGETFRRLDYGQREPLAPPWRSGVGRKQVNVGNQPTLQASEDSGKGVPPKLVLFVRNGTRPRKVVRVLLNKRNAPSFDGALSHITDCVKLDSGAVRKIFTLDGKQVLNLQELFSQNAVFLAYGSERHNRDDFELDLEEYRCLQTLSKATGRRGLSMTSSAISKPSRKMCGSEEHLTHSGRHSPALRSPALRYKSPKPKMPIKTKKPAGPTRATPTVPTATNMIEDGHREIPPEVLEEYDVGRVIGDGNFAVVRECVHRKSGQQFALKIIEKEKCRGKEHMIASEVAILRKVNHPNIVHLYAEFDYTLQLFLVMEYVKGGDLFDSIAAANKFNERDSATLTRHLASALSYLHQRRIVHRDIKPENLLVDIDPAGNRILKLGDFGLAQEVTVPLYMVCGTPIYVAPEILAETGYGLKVDIWAAGVILYIMLCGFPPFVSATNDQEELFDLILSGVFEFPSPYWDEVSDPARELVASMLQVDQELRFSAEDVLDHPWLSDCYSDDEASLQLYHKLGVHFDPPDNSNGSNHQMISVSKVPCDRTF